MLCSYVAGRLTFTAEVRYFVAIKALYIMPAGTKDLVDIVLVSECQMVTAWKSAPPTPPPPSDIDMMTHTHTRAKNSFVALLGCYQTCWLANASQALFAVFPLWCVAGCTPLSVTRFTVAVAACWAQAPHQAIGTLPLCRLPTECCCSHSRLQRRYIN